MSTHCRDLGRVIHSLRFYTHVMHRYCKLAILQVHSAFSETLPALNKKKLEFATTLLDTQRTTSNELCESTVKWRAKGLDVLVEVNGSHGTLGDAFGRELEFLCGLAKDCEHICSK